MKVLVVDDSDVLRKITVFNLKKLQMDVEETVDGIDGLEKMREWHPDVVILDIMMPRMDGFTVLKEMKKDDQIRNIPGVQQGGLFLGRGFVGRELVNDPAGIPLARIEHNRCKFRMVHRVREVRRLQAECAAERINRRTLAQIARNLSLEEISGIELNARFCGPDFHDAPGLGILDARIECQFSRIF